MEYLWFKALHIAAVATWIGGMLAVALTVVALAGKAAEEAADRSTILNAMRQWDRRVTTPAMLLVWSLGLVLAIRGGWSTAPWLLMKLALVLMLSALHGMLSGTLRRLAHADGSPPSIVLRHGPEGILIALLAIVVLVVIKPF